MLNNRILCHFLCYILIFILGGILITRFARLLSYLFFVDDYFTKHFNEMEPIFKLKNKKLAWILSFLLPIPIICALYFLKFSNIGGFLSYLLLLTKPKTAFYTLSYIYFSEGLVFLIFILEQKLAKKLYKSKQRMILAALFYAILIICLFIILIKYISTF